MMLVFDLLEFNYLMARECAFCWAALN